MRRDLNQDRLSINRGNPCPAKAIMANSVNKGIPRKAIMLWGVRGKRFTGNRDTDKPCTGNRDTGTVKPPR